MQDSGLLMYPIAVWAGHYSGLLLKTLNIFSIDVATYDTPYVAVNCYINLVACYLLMFLNVR